jgi:hypothetical protein
MYCHEGGSGRHARSASRARGFITQTEVTTDDVLEQTDGLLLDQLVDHVAKHGADGVEALVRLADVCQAGVVEKDLLDDEDGDGLAQLRARLHDAEAQGDDLGCEQEVYDCVVVVLLHLGGTIGENWIGEARKRKKAHLDEGAYDTEGGETKVFKGAGFGSRIQERIKKERYMRYMRRQLQPGKRGE